MAVGQQTSITTRMAKGFPGMISDASRDTNIRSYVSQEASAEIPFGVFVGQGSDDDGMVLLAATTDKVIGLLTHSNAYAKDIELGDVGLKPTVVGGVMSRGRAFVYVEEAVTPASPVLIRAIAVNPERAGATRDTADASDTIDASKWARFIETATGAGFVEIEFDVNNRAA